MAWAPHSLISYPFTSINIEHLLNITEIKKDVQKNFSWSSLPQEITSTKQTNPGQDLNWLLRCYSMKLFGYVHGKFLIYINTALHKQEFHWCWDTNKSNTDELKAT